MPVHLSMDKYGMSAFFLTAGTAKQSKHQKNNPFKLKERNTEDVFWDIYLLELLLLQTSQKRHSESREGHSHRTLENEKHITLPRRFPANMAPSFNVEIPP